MSDLERLAVDPDITVDQVRGATDRIRANLTEAFDLLTVMYETQAWRLLGYDTWGSYVDGELGPARLPRAFVGQLREAGMSSRAIAPVVGVSYTTVLRELRAAGGASAPPVVGIDGKHYVHTLAITPVPIDHTERVRALIAEITPRLHPACAVWSWITQGEFEDMASSIARSGLIHPIVLTDDGLILDGKLRWVACRMAGVEPASIVHDGDPVDYVISMNAYRVYVSYSQRAMACARAGQTSVALGDLVSWAAEIDAGRPDLAAAVMAGAISLRDAYAKFIAERDEHARQQRSRALFSSVAPDLAELEVAP